MKRSLVLCLVAFATNAGAQNICSSLQAANDMAQRNIADLKYGQAAGDDSAARATMRQMEIATHLLVTSINLSLMEKHKCPAPTAPVGFGENYALAALECKKAQLTKGYTSETTALCQPANWTPMLPTARK